MDIEPAMVKDNATIACNFGAVFLQTGDRERSSQFFKNALALKPDMKIALQGLHRALGKG